MADVTYAAAGGTKKKLIDMGDGTHAEVVSTTAPVGGATLSEQESQTTLLTSIDNTLASTPTELPKQPLMATSYLTYVHVTRSTSGETLAVSATSGQTTRVHRVTITVAGAVTVELLDGSGGTSLRKWVFAAAVGVVMDFSERDYAKTTANTALYVKTSAAVAVDVGIDYIKSA